MPLLLSVTLFAESPVYLLLLQIVPTVLLLLIPPREAGTPLPSSRGASGHQNSHISPSALRNAVPGESQQEQGPSATAPLLPSLTTYRAHMLLLTFICILAVDFPVFPRSLAKCETFGASIVCRNP